MGWGDARDDRRWQRELEAQIRALPTYEDETPDGGPVAPLPRDLPRPPRVRRARTPRPAGRPHERRRTVVTVAVTVSVIGAMVVFSLTPAADALRALVGLGGDRGESSTYAFLKTQPVTGQPVTWSSCEPIRYVVNPQGAPDGWESTIQDAVREVAQATGLEFVDEGTTSDRAFDDRYDDRGRELPVLIGWATPEEEPQLDGDTVGFAGADSYTRPIPGGSGRPDDPTLSYPPYATGRVVLDGPAFDRMERAGTEGQQRAIVMHELAHLVGLDHVEDDRQLMYATTTFQTTFGNGDLEGLRLLGEGPC